ncbi:MAG: DUF1761 domain-containing protein [Terracidiphilus sp.]|jgi:hypothetical protein
MHAVTYSAILLSLVLSKHQLILVLVTAVLQWLLGALWYGVIFRKSWRKLVGFAEGEKPKNQIFGMVTFLVACLLLSYVLAQFLSLMQHLAGVAGLMGPSTFTAGMKLGIICWLGFLAPPLFTQHIYENRRVNLFAINVSYWLLAMALGGGLLAAFHD